MINYADLMTKAERLRKHFGEDNHSPIDIFSLAQNIEKLTLVYYPLGNIISGMCIKGSDKKCLIALNSAMTLGRQRFTLAHEFYHLYYDNSLTSFCTKQAGKDNETEKAADAFAAYFLMPRAALSEKVESLEEKHDSKLNLRDIIRIEQYFQASHQTTLYQLSSCNYINHDELNSLLNVSVKRQAEAIGYSSDLYQASPESRQYCTYGYYINQADLLQKKELISDGKYEELLLAAFRDDLVYGIEEGGDLID